MTTYQSIQRRVAAFQQYYRMANERPLFGFFLGSEYPLFRYPFAGKLPIDRPLVPDDLDVPALVADSRRLFETHEQCGGDFIWSGSAFWGIPWLEAALGCGIHADLSSGSATSRPPDRFSGPSTLPEFHEASPWVCKMIEMIDALADASAGRWPIGTTRMRGISDLLSALYGSQQFIFAMMERPEEVKAVCARLTEFWIRHGRCQLEHVPLFHGGVGSFYYNMWAPSGTVWHQEDAVALLSPELFDEFIWPCDEKIARAFDHCILHMHPVGHLPLERYVEIPWTAMELHVDEGGPRARELYDKHLMILEKHPLLIWGKLDDDDLDWIFSRVPPAGLAVMAVVDTPAQAQWLWKRYV